LHGAGLRVGHGGSPVGATLQLDHEPVAHRHGDVGNALIQRPSVTSGLIGTKRHDDPPADLDRLQRGEFDRAEGLLSLDPPDEPAVQIAPHNLEDRLAVLT
jgi:hypothetical protein